MALLVITQGFKDSFAGCVLNGSFGFPVNITNLNFKLNGRFDRIFECHLNRSFTFAGC
jgi:hypothetical protein